MQANLKGRWEHFIQIILQTVRGRREKGQLHQLTASFLSEAEQDMTIDPGDCFSFRHDMFGPTAKVDQLEQMEAGPY